MTPGRTTGKPRLQGRALAGQVGLEIQILAEGPGVVGPRLEALARVHDPIQAHRLEPRHHCPVVEEQEVDPVEPCGGQRRQDVEPACPEPGLRWDQGQVQVAVGPRSPFCHGPEQVRRRDLGEALEDGGQAGTKGGRVLHHA